MNNHKSSHKDWVQATFDSAASHYGEGGCSFFDYFGNRLVELATPKKGDAILDIATGKGAVLFPAAKAVGETGKASGIDISPQMIMEAKKRSPYSWISLQEMDAEKLLFADKSFDIVYIAFGLFFLPNVLEALRECTRVLKPKGRLAVSVWGDRSPIEEWLSHRVQALGISQNLSVQNLFSEERIRELLLQTGFKNLHIHKESKAFWHESAEAWWASLWTHAIRARLELLPEDALTELKKEVEEHVGKGRVKDGRTAIYCIAEV